MKKKYLLTFIIFISVFFCLNIDVKADTTCNYFTSNKIYFDKPSSEYLKFYNYLYYRKYPDLYRGNSEFSDSVNYSNIIDEKLKGIIENMRKFEVRKPKAFNPFKDIKDNEDIELITISYTINGSKVLTSGGDIIIGGKKYEIGGTYAESSVYTIDSLRENQCPDLLFVTPTKIEDAAGNRVHYVLDFRIDTATYFDGDYSNMHEKIQYPTYFKEGQDYLIAINTDSPFANYYNKFQCVLEGYSSQFNYGKEFQDMLNEIEKTGFFNLYESMEQEIQGTKENKEAINALMKHLAMNFDESKIKEYNKIFRWYNPDNMVKCFGGADKAYKWFSENDNSNQMKYLMVLKSLISKLADANLAELRKGYLDDAINDEPGSLNQCYKNCQGLDGSGDDIPECEESCDKQYPAVDCKNKNQKEYEECVRKCGKDNKCIDTCKQKKDEYDSKCALLTVKCERIVDPIKSTIDETVFNKIYDEIYNECGTLTSDEGYEDCMVTSCQEYLDDSANFEEIKDDIEDAYNNIQNGTTEAQKATDDIIDKYYDTLIDMGGIEVKDDSELCKIYNEIKPYKNFILNVIRVGGVILVLVLTGLDGIQTIASLKEDDNKKFFSRLKSRLICIAILILVPTIIDFVVKIFIGTGCE